MKKILKLLPLFLIAILGSTLLYSCDDDDDEVIGSDSLPSAAKAFIQQYYPAASIINTTKDKDDYEVTLSEGTRIDFNKSGEWTDVDAPIGKTIPSGFYPAAIDTYVGANFQGIGINEISKETGGYDVELVTGTELVFNYEGSFVGFDR